MNWAKVRYWLTTIGLFILTVCIAGLVGYHLGSDNTTKQWLEGSQVIVPNVIDYAIERYKESPPMFAESNKELIKEEGLLLFYDSMGIRLEGVKDWMEHTREYYSP